jgi:cupin fold WbuC family metalloprotein
MKSVIYKKDPIISVDDMFSLKSVVDNSNDLARICYHESVSSALHVMLIRLPSRKLYPVHRHLDFDESVVLVEGDLYINLFDDSGILEKTINLKNTAVCKDAEFGMITMQYQWHSVGAGKSGAVFLEIKPGPFDKSMVEFASWDVDHM